MKMMVIRSVGRRWLARWKIAKLILFLFPGMSVWTKRRRKYFFLYFEIFVYRQTSSIQDCQFHD